VTLVDIKANPSGKFCNGFAPGQDYEVDALVLARFDAMTGSVAKIELRAAMGKR